MTEFELFQSALEIEEPAARKALLDSHRADHPELVARVETLLAAHDENSLFLDTPVVEQLAEQVTEPCDPPSGSAVKGTVHMAADSSLEGPMTATFAPGAPAATAGLDDEEEDDALGYLTPSDKPGSLGRLSHYEVQQVLGRGAFGIVLKALDEKLQRVVAIKVLAPQMAATSPARKRFLREARSSAAVRHEHVVNIHAVEEQPVPYLVMEYIPGRTLQQRLNESGPMDVKTVVRLGRQIAEGLAAAHERELIHRDIKPGNILLEAGVVERVKITDFGLARAADDASMTQSGLIAGTPMYMAPEQAQGQKLDQRADLFSLGSVLYQMISGRPPFRAATTLAVLKRVVEEAPRPIQEIIPETPNWLCDIIARLHAKNPEERFQTAAEVAEVLTDCESKLNSKQEVTVILPTINPPSPPAAKFVPRLLLGLLLLAGVVGVTEATGVTRFWRGPLPVAPVSEGAPATVATVSRSAEEEVGQGGGPESPEEEPFSLRRKSTKTVVNVVPTAVPQTQPTSSLPATFKNSLGMEFVIVPRGKSWLGGGKNRFGKLEVEMPNDFYLGKYEVTQDHWLKVMGTNPASCHEGTTDELPMESVTWDACQEFLAKLNERERETGWTYRLPTEVEWEYACRGGPMPDRAHSRFDFYFAAPTNNFEQTQANFLEETTTPVGVYSPNSLGLYDMHGNVHEWCLEAIEGPYGRLSRAHRGGCWRFGPDTGRASTEGWFPPHGASRHLGLRVARVPAAPPGSDSTPSRPPFTPEDVRRLATLPFKERVAAVINELKARHPGLDGTSRHTLEDGKVTELVFRPHDGRVVVTDLSPLTALPDVVTLNLWNVSGVRDLDALKGHRLTGLVLGGHDISSPLSSLEPLRGMPLVNLQLYNCDIQDLEPLRGMPLKLFALDRCARVQNIAVLQGIALENLSLGYTGVQDLAALRGMPLKHLSIQRTGVTDLTPLKGMPLQTLLFTPKSITTGLEVVREMTTLQQIGVDYENYTNPADFWARYDKGEFRD